MWCYECQFFFISFLPITKATMKNANDLSRAKIIRQLYRGKKRQAMNFYDGRILVWTVRNQRPKALVSQSITKWIKSSRVRIKPRDCGIQIAVKISTSGRNIKKQRILGFHGLNRFFMQYTHHFFSKALRWE